MVADIPRPRSSFYGTVSSLLVHGGGRQRGGVLGWADRWPALPGRLWVLPDLDLDSSDSSLRSEDEDSILGLLVAAPLWSTRRLPCPGGRGVVRSTVSLSWALLQDSRPGVVSSDSLSVSLDRIPVKDSSWASSSMPDPLRSLPASTDSVGVVSLSDVLPLM